MCVKREREREERERGGREGEREGEDEAMCVLDSREHYSHIHGNIYLTL